MRKIHSIQPGQKFGRWTVLRDLGTMGHNRMWECECECGTKRPVASYILAQGKSTQCLDCKTVDLSGQKFGNLTATKRERGSQWLCECECGGTRVVKGWELQNGAKFCGRCASRERGLSQTSKINRIERYLRRIERQAATRGIPFLLTTEEAETIWDKQDGKCAISGIALTFGRRRADKSSASLDRIDNHGPYAAENVQFIHKHLNIMRGEQDLEEFVTEFKALCEAMMSQNLSL